MRVRAYRAEPAARVSRAMCGVTLRLFAEVRSGFSACHVGVRACLAGLAAVLGHAAG